MEMESWDAWDTNQPQPPSPTQYNQSNSSYHPNNQSNPAYYQNGSRPPPIGALNQTVRGRKTELQSEPEPDYFTDMVPDFKRPVKVRIYFSFPIMFEIILNY
jgi:hypothetical protein